MPAVRPPTLWLTVAATTISTVAVATMVVSGGPRRSLNFAGAILLPDNHPSAAAQPTYHPSRPSAPGTSVRATATASTSPSPRPSSHPAPVAVLVASPSHSRPGNPSSVPPARPSTTPAPSPSGRSNPPGTGVVVTPGGSWSSTVLAQALFGALNTARAGAGLAPLAWSVGLQRSAASHNVAMAAADQLAARTSDEPALGVRQVNQGVLGDYAAENLGQTEILSRAGALAVQQAMLAEQPPEDGQRQNLMSSSLSTVGIDVLLDPAHGRLWITEDFAQLS